MPANPDSDLPPPERRPRSVTFRTSLLSNLILLILALAMAILAVFSLGSSRAVRTLCQDLVDSGTDRVETDLQRIFAPVPLVLHIFRDWSAAGILETDDPEELNRLFAPVLSSLPQLVGFSIGFSDGSGYLISRSPEGFRNQLVTPETSGKTSRWISWESLDGPREESILTDAYDPRTRPWYQIVADDDVREGEVRWTEPYSFFSTGEPGITASIRLHDAEGRLAVISVDLLLDDVSRLSERLEISPNGFVVVTTSDVRTIALPRHPDLAEPERRRDGLLKNPDALGIPLFAEASAQLRKRFRLQDGEILSMERGLSDRNRPFRWSFDSGHWWTYVRPSIMTEGPQLWIGVAVPEDDFLGELKEGRKYLYGLAALALVIATFISIRLSRRFSSPIQALTQQANRLRTLNTERVDQQSTEIEEIAQLFKAQESMRLALNSFAKYVPSEVVRELLEKGEAAVIGGRRCSMSLLFTDVEGFTRISEQMTPDALTMHMASYFEAMIGTVTEHDGTVDKLIGDAIVAFWSAPKVNLAHARDAVRAALLCHQRLEELNAEWESQGLPRLPTRFGISTGEAVVGNVGSLDRLNYTALGDSVNLASRLEGANKFYGTKIIAAATTVNEAGGDFVWRKLDRVRVVGRKEPELIFELLGTIGEVSELRMEFAAGYEKALSLYFEKDFPAAQKVLEALKSTFQSDLSVIRLRGKIEGAARESSPAEWNDFSELTEK